MPLARLMFELPVPMLLFIHICTLTRLRWSMGHPLQNSTDDGPFVFFFSNVVAADFLCFNKGGLQVVPQVKYMHISQLHGESVLWEHK